MSPIGAIGGSGNLSAQALADIQNQINIYARQLSTGKKATTISELGKSVSRSIDLRAHLARLSAYDESSTSATTNLQSATAAINSFAKSASQVEVTTLSLATTPTSSNRGMVTADLRRQFSELVDYLNTEVDGNYLFGGKQSGIPPVIDSSLILDGSGGRAGLKQYIAERQAADLGTAHLGRLQLSNTPNSISLAETGTGGVFGFTIKGVTSSDPAITASTPSGAPPQTTFTVNGQPASGSTLTVTLGLPDGTTTDVTLTASGGSGTNPFAIGATVADTTNNIKAALQTALGSASDVQLYAASAKAAAIDFFKGSTTNPPRRVAGPPYDTATGFVAGTSDNTVLWYQGTDDSNDPRNDRVTQIDERASVGFGARANEPGFIETLANAAVLAVTGYSSTNETLAQSQFSELRDRARSGLSQAKTDVTATSVSVGLVQKTVKARADDQNAQKTVFETALSSIEDAPLDQTAVSLSTLQTQLQALYQLTAKLQSLSLANYL